MMINRIHQPKKHDTKQIDNDEVNNLILLWYKGLELWYNDGDYMNAMIIWQRATDRFFLLLLLFLQDDDDNCDSKNVSDDCDCDCDNKDVVDNHVKQEQNCISDIHNRTKCNNNNNNNNKYNVENLSNLLCKVLSFKGKDVPLSSLIDEHIISNRDVDVNVDIKRETNRIETNDSKGFCQNGTCNKNNNNDDDHNKNNNKNKNRNNNDSCPAHNDCTNNSSSLTNDNVVDCSTYSCCTCTTRCTINCSTIQHWSSLLLFLGGCYLDSGQFDMARKSLYRCFQCCLYGFVSTTRTRIISNSSFETNGSTDLFNERIQQTSTIESIFIFAILDYIATYEEEQETVIDDRYICSDSLTMSTTATTTTTTINDTTATTNLTGDPSIVNTSSTTKQNQNNKNNQFQHNMDQSKKKESHWIVAQKVIQFAIHAMKACTESYCCQEHEQKLKQEQQQKQSYWTNIYQRPMYMSPIIRDGCRTIRSNRNSSSNDKITFIEMDTITKLMDKGHVTKEAFMSSSSSPFNCHYNKPVYERHEHPQWCRILEDHYPIILQELQHLLRPRNNNTTKKIAATTKSNVTTATSTCTDNNTTMMYEFPNHWPVVGSGFHRDGAGEHDGKVVRSCTDNHNGDGTTTSTSTVVDEDDDEGTGDDINNGDWREIVLFGSGAGGNNGNGNSNGSSSSNCSGRRLAPKTCAIIQKYIPDAVSLAEAGGGEVIFSVLRNNTHLLPHTASTNIRLTAHLGLIVPQPPRPSTATTITTTTTTTTTTTLDSADNAINGTNFPYGIDAIPQQPPPRNTTAAAGTYDGGECYIRVGERKCYWEPGKVLLFDDSYEHEVVMNIPSNRTCTATTSSTKCSNTTLDPSDSLRAVLLLRFWHPLLKTPEQRERALQEAIRMKQYDSMRRFCPPLPPPPTRIPSTSSSNNGMNNSTGCIYTRMPLSSSISAAVTRRSMEQSTCPSCWRNGYQSIRIESSSLQTTVTKTFVCVCGYVIQ